MMTEEAKACCFFGHRKITGEDRLRKDLYKVVEDLILLKKVNIFYFGSKSDFNELCCEVVSELKKKYPHIRRIYVRAEFPYIDDNYRDYLLKNYEDTYFPERAINAGKAVYVERNYELIDKSDFCIAFYDENYLPRKRRNSKRDLFEYQPKSGTKLAYEYAERKGKLIINIANCNSPDC